MGAAEYEKLYALLKLLLHVLKVHFIPPVCKFQGGSDQGSLLLLNHLEKGVVNRRAHHYPVPLIRQGIDDEGTGADNAGNGNQLLFFYVKVIAGPVPFNEAFIVPLRREGVPIGGMLRPVCQGPCDFRQGFKVHICDSKGNQVLPAEILLQPVPLNHLRIVSVKCLVKIVHVFLPTFLRYLSLIGCTPAGCILSDVPYHTLRKPPLSTPT